MFKAIKKLSPARIIALGFALVILIGSILLSLPCSVKEGVSIKYIDALYTSVSAVCVTGLITVDPSDTFTVLGQVFLCLLMQIGGLGVTAIGAGVMIAVRKKVDLKGSTVVREAMNLNSGKGIAAFLKNVFLTTLTFELCGAILSFFVFAKKYPPIKAIWISIFHSVAAFNNSGFDLLGNFQSLTAYRDNVTMNLVTCAMIFFGGIGFLVIREVIDTRFRWKKFSMHTKVVLSVSGSLLAVGTILFMLTDGVSPLTALFLSCTARTAGFSTYPMSSLSNAGTILMVLFMVIGASPGSTGGGIKTSTFFVLLQGIKSSATNKSEKAFKYSVPRDAFKKASVIVMFAIAVISFGTFVMCLLEPTLPIKDVLIEITSAFGTVGLSTGITPSLSAGSKILSMIIMYIGRLGPITVATLWYFTNGDRIRYPEGNIVVG